MDLTIHQAGKCTQPPARCYITWVQVESMAFWGRTEVFEVNDSALKRAEAGRGKEGRTQTTTAYWIGTQPQPSHPPASEERVAEDLRAAAFPQAGGSSLAGAHAGPAAARKGEGQGCWSCHCKAHRKQEGPGVGAACTCVVRAEASAAVLGPRPAGPGLHRLSRSHPPASEKGAAEDSRAAASSQAGGSSPTESGSGEAGPGRREMQGARSSTLLPLQASWRSSPCMDTGEGWSGWEQGWCLSGRLGCERLGRRAGGEASRQGERVGVALSAGTHLQAGLYKEEERDKEVEVGRVVGGNRPRNTVVIFLVLLRLHAYEHQGSKGGGVLGRP